MGWMQNSEGWYYAPDPSYPQGEQILVSSGDTDIYHTTAPSQAQIDAYNLEVSRARYAEEQAEVARQQAQAAEEARWRPGYDTLLKQMGALQSSTDIYRRGSPLSADTHMENIARTLAKDYGITNIGDIGVRKVERYYAGTEGNNENAPIPPYTAMEDEYFNKKDPSKIIPGYKFASENRGDGYSEYNLQPVPDGQGGTIVLPVQQYSKSGWGAFAQDIAPIIPLVNFALMANGVPPLTVAAGNVAFQAGAGNINDIGDILRTAAPVLIGDPGILGGAAKAYMAYNAFDKGDVLGGLSSLAGAAGFNGLANELRFVNAVKTGNIPGALVSLSNMSGLFDIPLKDDLGKIIKDADGTVQTIGNFKLAGGADDYITVKDAVQGATIAANLLSDNPNYGLALQMAGDLVSSKDTILAGRAVSLVEALNSGNPSAVNNAILSLSGQLNKKAPGSAPIENRTANAVVAAAAPDTSTAVNQALANTDPVTNLAATDLVAKNASGTQSTPEQIAALEVANANGLLAADLGTTFDTINVTGTNTDFRGINDDTITAGDIKPITSPITQLTANQIAALTSGNTAALTTKVAPALTSVQVTGRSSEAIGLNNDTLTSLATKNAASLTSRQLMSLTSRQIAALTTWRLGAITSNQIGALKSSQVAALNTKSIPSLASVQVTGRSSEAIGINNDTLTDIGTNTTSSLSTLTSAQVAALNSKSISSLTSDQVAALDTKDVQSLDRVTITGKADPIGVNDDTLTDTGTKTTSQITTLTSDQIGAISTDKITTLSTDKVTTLSTDKITTLTSTQIPAATSGPPAVTTGSTTLTSEQIGALTTTPARGLQALPTSDARYWRQTGATGTGGKGGVRFFDWYDTPENRTMAPPAMTTATFGALTSQQVGAIAPPTAKQYFNQATNRYYTDPTGTWQPPAGWTQTGLKGGGEVKTKHFDEGGWAVGFGGDSVDAPSYADFDIPIDSGYGDSVGYDYGYGDSIGYGDSVGYDYGYSDGGRDSYGSEAEGIFDFDTGRDTDEYLRSLPSDNASYGGGKDQTARYEREIRNASKVGLPNQRLNSNSLKGLADAAKSNPNLMKMLLGAGLGGLLGYMGRPKGIRPKGMQGGSLGLSQGQVYGALKGKPVQRAEGGEIDGYARGGGLSYLKSAEDGMADKIPATIDNKQPAKLSGGEFVIPADVVSHLGNGNSEAGAKQLYAMMDRIRHARTGTKKQGKQINPAKFTPK